MTRSTELTPKKEGNCNIVATWPRHVILLVIASNKIPLSLPIALTYCLVPDGSSFWYTKSHSSIVGNRLFYISLLKSPPAAIPFVGKHTSHFFQLQFWFLLINIPFVRTRPFFFRIRWHSDHLTKSCDWWRLLEQNQPRMALALGRHDSSLKRRCQALENFRDKAQDAWHVRRSEARLPGVYSTPLQEKLVVPMSL